MYNLKSISLLLFLTNLCFSVNGSTAFRNYDKIIAKEYNNIDIIADLPKERDFNFYLDSLEKAVNFYTSHKLYVDLNSAFGLFTVDVNLRSYLQQKQHYDIPVKIRSRLEKLLIKVNVLAVYFHEMVQKIKNVAKYKQDIKISELFYNKTTWSRNPDKFNTDLLKQTKLESPEKLKKMYGKWEDYLTNVDKPDEFTPSPAESSKCLQNLSWNSPSKSSTYCRIPSHCKKSMKEGTDFGYSLTHMLLFFIMARFSRQCDVYSEKDDKRLLDRYCTKSFTEVQYLALNNFQLPDLVAENIALCGLLGHAQFFRKLWLKKLTQFQTSKGCFLDFKITEKFERKLMKEGKEDKWSITNSNNMFLNEQCNPHFTAVSIATLSNTLRYIIETYYVINT